MANKKTAKAQVGSQYNPDRHKNKKTSIGSSANSKNNKYRGQGR